MLMCVDDVVMGDVSDDDDVCVLCDVIEWDEEGFICDVCVCWGGWKVLIEGLVCVLGGVRDDYLVMYVYGLLVMGKMLIVWDVVGRSGRSWAYASCVTEYASKLLYEVVVEELMLYLVWLSESLRCVSVE